MFHYDRGLKLTLADLAIDCPRRQPRAFISHAHFDHMARHVYALCTPETARLYHLRLGTRPVLEMPYRQTFDWGGLRLTTFPAGHCLGSAMLLADDGQSRLLYTGDFRLGMSLTAERADFPQADILVIESTYGDPRHCFQPREQAVEQLVALVRSAFDRGMPPVVQAYTLGKAQEVAAVLGAAGIPVLQHPEIYRVSEVYRQCGIPLENCRPYRGRVEPGHAIVVPPRFHRPASLPGLGEPFGIAVTGWATDQQALRRYGVEHAVVMSDHADYEELLEAVARVQAREIYCTHGPPQFVELLRSAGFNAFRLGEVDRRPQAAT
jgi:Cft2 family RNA processing exonuclease